jgi:DNA-binding transcriptional regulator GbsR (MarR family)
VIKLTKKEIELLEQLSSSGQMRGLTPAASKVLALLTISPVVDLTFDQIRETVGIGKSATSAALTQLQHTKHIEYSNKLGERKRYFRLRVENIEHSLHNLAEMIKRSAKLYEEIIANRPSDTAQFNEALRTKVAGLKFIHSLLLDGILHFQSKTQNTTDS